MGEVAQIKKDELTPAVTSPARLVEMAIEKGANLDVIQQMMDLQERYEANEARKAFNVAMTAFKSEPLTITKNKHVKFKTSSGFTEYDHASLDRITKAVDPQLAKHGLSYRWEVEQADGNIHVTCIVMHELGHQATVKLAASADQSGGKNSIQAIGSAVSYLQRYTLLSALGLATGGADDDGRSATSAGKWHPMTEEHMATLKAKVEEVCPGEGDALAKSLNLPTLEQIPEELYAAAIERLNLKAKRKAGK